MMVVPAATPLTTPEVDPIVATEVDELLHIPQVVALLKVLVVPTHTDVVPVILPTFSAIV